MIIKNYQLKKTNQKKNLDGVKLKGSSKLPLKGDDKMDNIEFKIEKLVEMKEELNSSYERSRNLSIITTKFEDLIIYLEAFKNKL